MNYDLSRFIKAQKEDYQLALSEIKNGKKSGYFVIETMNLINKDTISKMKKDLSLAENFAEMGLGWLSREDKLEYTQKAKSVTVKLR